MHSGWPYKTDLFKGRRNGWNNAPFLNCITQITGLIDPVNDSTPRGCFFAFENDLSQTYTPYLQDKYVHLSENFVAFAGF